MITFIILSLADTIGKIVEIIVNYGIGQGLLTILVLGAIYFLYKRFEKLYDQALDAKQKEIDRLAAENQTYRDIFMKLVKERLDIEDLSKRQNIEEEETLELIEPPEKTKKSSDNKRKNTN